MVDGIVLPFLISCDFTVATVHEIETDGRMQSIVVSINAALL